MRGRGLYLSVPAEENRPHQSTTGFCMAKRITVEKGRAYPGPSTIFACCSYSSGLAIDGAEPSF